MKRKSLELKIYLVLILFLIIAGCASHNQHHHEEQPTLRPPENADSVAAQALLEGNRFFSDHQWTAAIKKYKKAIQTQPSLAEAHYNLAVTLDQQGRFSESRLHYRKAADLAPGNKVIWNSPPFRQYETVEPDTQEQASDGHMGHQH